MKAAFLFCLLLSCILLHRGACEPLKPDCTAVLCLYCPRRVQLKRPVNECCHPCLPYCPCEGHLQKACLEHGFKDMILLPGQAVYAHHGTQKCKCHVSGEITCFPVCPPLPPKCKYIEGPKDGCPQCGCLTVYGDFIPAGNTFTHKCETCTCPPEGGQIQCTETKTVC